MSKLPTKATIEALRPLILTSLFCTGLGSIVKIDRDRLRKRVPKPRGFVVDAALIEVLNIYSLTATCPNTLFVHMSLPVSRKPEQNMAEF